MPGVVKVTWNGTTVIDHSDSTVEADKVLEDYIAYEGDGDRIVGTSVIPGKWIRPSEWPNYDLLTLTEESLFFTYDNRVKGSWMSIACSTTPWNCDRVQINSDGTVTVLEHHNVTDQVYTEDIPIDAGDWVAYRMTPSSGKHLEKVSMNSSSSGNGSQCAQLCVERYGYLPSTTSLTYGYAYRSWGCFTVVSDTILGCDSLQYPSMADMLSIRNIYNDTGKLYFSNFYNCPMNQFEFERSCRKSRLCGIGKVDFSSYARDCGMEYIDASGITLTGTVTKIDYIVSGAKKLRGFKFPKGDYSGVTSATAAFSGCWSIEFIDLPDTFTCSLPTNFTNECKSCKAIILRAKSVVPLGVTGAIYNRILWHNNPCIYVPSSLINDYKTATNWVTLYASYPNMFAAIEGSIYEEV